MPQPQPTPQLGLISSTTPPEAFAIASALPADPVELWSLVTRAAASNRRVRVLLRDLKLVKADQESALLRATTAEVHELAGECLPDIAQALSAAWGRGVRVALVDHAGHVGNSAAAPPLESGAVPSRAAPSRGEPGREQSALPPDDDRAPAAPPLSAGPAADHPLVRQAMQLFNARIVGVQARRPELAGSDTKPQQAGPVQTTPGQSNPDPTPPQE